MGAGKSTIGRKLARREGLRFFDSDYEIEKRTGVRIGLIFDIEGEEGFRKREKQVIDELTGYSGIVLATGGGAVLDPENRENMQERGFVIYLRSGIDQLLRRTSRDKKRPLLNTDDRRQAIEKILSEREPLYEKTADLIVDTDNRTVNNIVDNICNHLTTK